MQLKLINQTPRDPAAGPRRTAQPPKHFHARALRTCSTDPASLVPIAAHAADAPEKSTKYKQHFFIFCFRSIKHAEN